MNLSIASKFQRLAFCLGLFAFAAMTRLPQAQAQFDTADASASATPTLHVVILIDTSEPKRKADRLIDMQTNLNLMNSVEDAMEGELKVNKLIIKDADWSGDSVIRDCKALDVKPNDAVYFFYNGHGFRTASMDADGDTFPAMCLEKDADGSDGNLKLSNVYKVLKAKNPRLLLVIADTCNSFAPDSWTPATRGTFRKQWCKELFVNSRGSYIASGSQPGEYTWTNFTTGSYYTNQLVGNIKRVLSANEYNEANDGWDAILKKSCETIRFTSGETQTPQYKNNPSSNN